MATNLGTAVGYLTLDITGFSRGIDQATREMERIGTSSESMLDKMGTGFTKAGLALTATVTAPVVGFGSSILREGTTFEEAMTEVKNVANLANSDIGDFRDAVGDLGFQMTETGDDIESMYKTMYMYAVHQGSETRYTAEEVADAFYYMGLAGWDATKMMYGLRPVLDLAAATNEDLARTSDIVTDSMNALQIPVEDLALYTNVLAEMTRSSNTTLDQAGEAFKYVAPMAGALGYSYEDLAVAIGEFANVGVKGSQAGTGLRQALNSLTNPSERAQEVLDRLNWSIYDEQGNAKELSVVMKELRDMFSYAAVPEETLESYAEFVDYLEEAGLTDSFDEMSMRQQTEMFSEWASTVGADGKTLITDYQKLSDVIRLVGIRALPGMLGIINEDQSDFDKFTLAINSANEAYDGLGTSAGMAAELMDTTQGSIYKLTSSISELKIQLFELLGGPFQGVIDKLTEIVKWFNSLDSGTQELIIWIAAAAAAIGPLLLVLGKIAPAISGIVTAFTTLKGVFAASKAFSYLDIDEFGNAVEMVGGKFVDAGDKKDGFAKNVTGTLNPALGKGSTAAGGLATSIGGIVTAILGWTSIIGGTIVSIFAFVDAWKNGYDELHAILMGLGITLVAVGAIVLGAPALVAGAIAAVVFIVASAILLIKENWEDVKAWLIDYLNWVKDTYVGFFTNALNTIKFFVNNVITVVKWFFENALTSAKFMFNGLVSVGSMFFKNAWNTIKTFFNNAANSAKWFIDLIVGFFKTFFTNAFNSVKFFVDNVINICKLFWDTLVSIVTAAFNFISNVIKSALTFISNLFTTIWNAIKTFILDILEALKDKFEESFNAIMEIISSVLTYIQTLMQTVWNAIYNFIAGIWDSIKSKITSVLDTIRNYIQSVMSTIQNIIQTIWNAIKSFIMSVTESIRSTVVQKFESLRSSVTSIIDALKNIVQSKIDEMKSKVISIIENLKSMVESKITDMKNTLDNIFDNMKTAIINKVNEIYNGIISTFTDIKSKMEQIGSNIVDGLWNGISNGWDWLKDRVSDLCSKLVDNAKDALKIGSPSKVFSDEVGRWLPPGIAEGFEDAMPEAEKDINESIDDMIDRVNAEDAVFNFGTSYSDLQTVMSDSYSIFADSVQTTEERLNASLDSMYEKMYSLVLLEQQLNSGTITNTGYGTNTTMNGNTGGMNTTNNNTGNTFIFNSPKAIDEIEAARQMEKTQREMEEGFI